MEFWRVLAKLFVDTEILKKKKKDYENSEERKRLVCPGRRFHVVAVE